MSQREQRAEQRLCVQVIPFTAELCPFDKSRQHTWREWHSFRNQVLDILSHYGSVGQMGKMPMLETDEESDRAWEVGEKMPDFFVVDDDMYGNSVRVEADCTLIRPPLFDELIVLLAQWRDWSSYFALRKGGLWIFRDRILTEGEFFANCLSVTGLYHRCSTGGEART